MEFLYLVKVGKVRRNKVKTEVFISTNDYPVGTVLENDTTSDVMILAKRDVSGFHMKRFNIPELTFHPVEIK